MLTIVNFMHKKLFSLNREIFDSHNPEDLKFKSKQGLNEELVRQISLDKKEPEWMLQKRLEGLKLFNELEMPKFGPDLSELKLEKIHFYMKPNAEKNAKNWEDVPKEIRETYEKLGIPEAERESLAGVGAQYESEVIYHNMKEDLREKGVIFTDMDEAVKKCPDLVKKYFMTSCISPNLHKFVALHAAVWSGGSFIYVPKNVKVDLPLQAYFRMNAKNGGQFEHTLIIADEGSEIHYIEGCSAPLYSENSLHAGCVEIHALKNSKIRYSSIENWSKSTYNLNTKRAIVHKNALMEWINGNMGSKVTMLYPCSILLGENAKTNYVGIAFASDGQNQDTGCKVYHLSPNTSSTVISKSICKEGGITTYRGLVDIKKGCENSITNVKCEGLMLDNKSKAITIPSMQISENNVDASHEASVGKVGEEQLFYLMSRGLSKEEATKMIVLGFIEPLTKELPIEYAVELNKLIELEIENSVV